MDAYALFVYVQLRGMEHPSFRSLLSNLVYVHQLANEGFPWSNGRISVVVAKYSAGPFSVTAAGPKRAGGWYSKKACF